MDIPAGVKVPTSERARAAQDDLERLQELLAAAMGTGKSYAPFKWQTLLTMTNHPDEDRELKTLMKRTDEFFTEYAEWLELVAWDYGD